MRPVTKRVTAGLLVVGALLLALGAVPSLLRAGDPYYLAATATEPPEGVEPVDAANLSERQYRYTFAALETATDGEGRSGAYYRGPLGIKGAFTHSPFDEVGAYEAQYPDAVDGEAAYVRAANTTYRLEVVQG